MRCDPDILNKILESLRIKSQFETNTSSAFLLPKDRCKIEEEHYDYPEHLPPKLRPIYGYITNDSNGEIRKVDMYGSIAIRFKDATTARTTVTMRDSFCTDLVKPAPQIASL